MEMIAEHWIGVVSLFGLLICFIAALLNTTYEGEAFPWYRRTRWNNRKPGSGRFPEFGLIRCFGDTVHTNLHHPINISKVFNSKAEALDFLRLSGLS